MLHALFRWLIFPRYLLAHPGPGPARPGLERHWLDVDGASVEYWFIRAPAAPADQARPAVLFAHGNGELIDQWVGPFAHYGTMGAHLVLVEYRGYGRSTGTPSEAALASDFAEIAGRVSARPDVDPGKLIYHGRSIGGGVVCSAARLRAPAALILESTFTEIHAVARRFGAPRRMVGDRFDNLTAVTSLTCPCLILHGEADTLIPPDHARHLAQACPGARLRMFPDVTHNAAISLQPGYWDEIGRLVHAL